MQIAVLGGGSWGTALANLLACKGVNVNMYCRDEDAVQSINTLHYNKKYLPAEILSSNLVAVNSVEEAMHEAEVCLLAIPCQSMRSVLHKNKAFFRHGLPVVCVSKGLEASTLNTMSDVVRSELPNVKYSILSGPSFALEVVRSMPTAVVLGCADKNLGAELRDVFSTPLFRAYSSCDVVGVEIGGAIKNVIAIAAGLSDGLGYGYNARAGLITRGLAEVCRLGVAMGALPATFMGLSGLGDLVLTCTGDLSRNRQVGLGMARGLKLGTIISELNMVAEGVKTAEAAVLLGTNLQVDLPIATAVLTLLQGEMPPEKVVHTLMTRTLKDE